ncbi:GntP family permease [Brevibacterium aurantiacum]|uniref:Gnt-I system low-affinity gluconate transporter n=1 Tax=Brevibacterium aurantiacum TaxID=273384 RepID=A0A2H1KNC2_BREAU|nr:SLC13 family permease [Brevibacterium aurantiacum]SMY01201.1 Gnt-I system low-affinity gluconate transporter [Brevibacterium aurantiacum]
MTQLISHEAWVIIAAVLAVGLLLLLIIKFKWQEFLALLTTSIVFGIAVGGNPNDLLEFIVEEMGAELGQLALVIGLGSIFGMMLQRAGAAERIAHSLVDRLSDWRILIGLCVAGFLVGTSVYIDVAIVILVPMLYQVAQRTGKSLLYFGIPLCAGLSTAYTFMPPAPGPLATAGLMKADMGLVILFGVICGVPAMLIAGPIFGRYIASKIYVPAPIGGVGGVVAADSPTSEGNSASERDVDGTDLSPKGSPSVLTETPTRDLPRLSSVIAALLLPLILIVIGTIGRLLGGGIGEVFQFIGNPVIALLLTCLASLFFFGIRRGVPKDEIQAIATSALGPAGLIILVTGAGSVFGAVLVDSGLGDTLSSFMKDASVPLVVFGFIVASVMRISQGSGLVAMVTGASFSAPLAEALNASPAVVALTCIAIACGGAGYSHVNDSGFWMANRYFGMSVANTLKTWTVMKTIVALVGFTMVLIVSIFV